MIEKGYEHKREKIIRDGKLQKLTLVRLYALPILLGIGTIALLVYAFYYMPQNTPVLTITPANGLTLTPESRLIATATKTLAATSVQSTATITTVVLPSETSSSEEYKIGYLQENRQGLDLYIANFHGDTSKVSGDLVNFAVSQNGQYVAKAKDGLIYSVNTLTADEAPLFESIYQRNYHNLSWSPDGKFMFAMVSGYYSGYQRYSYVFHSWIKDYIISATDLSIAEISNREGFHSVKNPQWSPDNKTIGYWESGDIFVVNPEMKQVKNITTYGAISDIPFDWSPDGKYILVALKNDNSIYRVDVNSGEQTLLVEGTDEYLQRMSWSHNGDKILYSYSNKLYIFDIATNQSAFIANGSTSAWSPDDKMILFLNDGDIFIVNTDGTGKVNITNSPSIFEESPFWIDLSVHTR